jgi:hypothetical protein
MPSLSWVICNPSNHSCQEGSRCSYTRICTCIRVLSFCRAFCFSHVSCEKYSREAGGLTSPVFVIPRVICRLCWVNARSPTTIRHEEKGEQLEKMQMLGDRAGFCTTAHTQFAIDTADLGLNSIEGDNQFLGDLCVCSSGDQQSQYPLLLGT